MLHWCGAGVGICSRGVVAVPDNFPVYQRVAHEVLAHVGAEEKKDKKSAKDKVDGFDVQAELKHVLFKVPWLGIMYYGVVCLNADEVSQVHEPVEEHKRHVVPLLLTARQTSIVERLTHKQTQQEQNRPISTTQRGV